MKSRDPTEFLPSLAEHISLALGSEFKIYLPQLVPQMIRVLSHDTSKDRNVTGKLLLALCKFGPTLNDYMNLILPKVFRCVKHIYIPWAGSDSCSR